MTAPVIARNEAEGTLAIYGALPPPHGGVSVHVQRLVHRLRAQGVPCRLYEQTSKAGRAPGIVPVGSSLPRFSRFLLFVPERLIHFHTNRAEALCAAAALLRARGKRLVVTLHSEAPMRAYARSKWQRLMMRRWLLASTHVVCVSDAIAAWARSAGVRQERISVVPAFLPPSPEETRQEAMPAEVRAFAAEHPTLVGTHGVFGYFIDGQHAYAFDQVAQLARALAERDPRIGIYTLITDCRDRRHRDEIMRLRRAWGLESSWLVSETPFPAPALFAKTDVFVRPTITDGDSVSVRECLWMGVPVVASDAVARPPGCRLFPVGDFERLRALVFEALDDPAAARAHVARFPQPDNGARLVDLLAGLLREQ